MVPKENYRKAAYVMYECAMRVGTEMVSLSGLKQQLKCYLATLNALRLVNPDYAWIVKPVLKVIDCHQPNVPPGVSPKHTHDGEIVTPAKVFLFCIRRLMGSTDQADPSCIYFRIS